MTLGVTTERVLSMSNLNFEYSSNSTYRLREDLSTIQNCKSDFRKMWGNILLSDNMCRRYECVLLQHMASILELESAGKLSMKRTLQCSCLGAHEHHRLYMQHWSISNSYCQIPSAISQNLKFNRQVWNSVHKNNHFMHLKQNNSSI